MTRLVEGFRARGITVLAADESTEPLHASGHPCQGELTDLYQILRPALVMAPVHGEVAHMAAANVQEAKRAGVGATLNRK